MLLCQQSYGFSSSCVWMWELDYKAGCQRIDAFELWYWRRLLRVPWAAGSSNQSILKEISPEYSLEGLMLKLKLQYFGHLMRRTDSLEETLMLGKIEGRRNGGQHRMRWLDDINGHEFEQALGVGDGQGSRHAGVHGITKSDTTEHLNWLTAFPLDYRACCLCPETWALFLRPDTARVLWGSLRYLLSLLNLVGLLLQTPLSCDGCQRESKLVGSSLTQLCLTLCNRVDCSMPGFPVLHCLFLLFQFYFLLFSFFPQFLFLLFFI